MLKEQSDYKKELSKKEYKNTLNYYLTRSLSLELVNIILGSIVAFTERSKAHKKQYEKNKKKSTIVIPKSKNRSSGVSNPGANA